MPDPWAPGERLYRTGDLARLGPDGTLEFLGRIDGQVKIRGFRIELGEIEAVLSRHPAVREVVVVAREDAPGDRRLVAYVACRREDQAGAGELRAFLTLTLPEFMVPAAFVLLPSLPRLPNGKLDRRGLPEPERAPAGRKGAVAVPRTPVEELIAGLWAELLGMDGIGVDDNFFELGGHSLMATQLTSRIRELFRVELKVRVVFEAPTMAGLAERIAAAQRDERETPEAPSIQPVPREGSLPLSFAQQRLWVLDQIAPGSAAYNLPVAVRLEGLLNAAALAASLAEIVRRHEALRTVFAAAGGEPVQVVRPADAFFLPAVDLSGLGERAEEEARSLALADAHRPFDLEQGPLFRPTLLHLAPQTHVALATMHHTVSDGWSRGVLIQELTSLYAAFGRGEAPSLPALPVQYGDYAVWQRRWLSGDVLAAEIDYWRRHLAGMPARLELPTDHPRPALRTDAGSTRSLVLGAELTASLHGLARGEGATLFMVLLAGFQTLLSRYAGQEDLAVGTPIAGRNRMEIEHLIGFFVNTLVLRAQIPGSSSLRDLLRRTRAETLEAYAHQDVPFEKLVEELAPERSLSYSPLFQVLFSLQNAPVRALELPGLSLTPLRLEGATAKFDLTFILGETAQGLAGALEYSTDLFEGPTVDRLLAHFRSLLTAMTADPGARLAELPLLSPAERHQIVTDWNDTRAPFAAGACLHDLFEAQVAQAPGATAAVCAELVLTYAQLNGRANQLAHHLVSCGARRGSLVAIYLERSPEMLVAVLGVLKAGAAYVPLDSAWPESRIAWILSTLGIRQILTQGSRLAAVQSFCSETELADVVCLDEVATEQVKGLRIQDRSHLDRLSTENPDRRADADDLAYVIFTSGTTGTPKGVMVCHRPVINLIEWVNRSFAAGPSDRLLFLTSLCFDLSVYDIFGILAAGGSVRVATGAEVRDPRQLLDILLREPITFWDSAPAALQQLVPFLPARPEPGSGDLRLVFLSGDWAPVTLPDRIRQAFPKARLISLGGATEATVWSNFHPIAVVEPGWVSIPYGRPIQNARYHILDSELAPAPVGVPGDLYIGGDCLFSGYAQEPRLTSGKLIPDPFGETGARLYRTGDRARYWPDGTMEFLGRLDHQVKIRGFRIELGEIEATLAQHPAVSAVAVLAREDRPGDKRLVAYVVARPDQPLGAGDLRAFLQEVLPAYMVPAAFVFLSSLPVTSNGKLDRRALPAPELQRSAPEAAPVAPRTPAEEILAAVWIEVLGVDEVGVADNFFELGGDSILSIQVVSRASRRGLRLTPRDMFEHPTIEGLAAVARRGSDSRDEVGPVTGPVPLTPIQLWFFAQQLPHAEHFNQALLLEMRDPDGGAVQSSLLRRAILLLQAHHDALRLRFEPPSPERPFWTQVSGEVPAAASFLHIDLAALPAELRAKALEACAAELQESLILGVAPLLRAALFTAASGQPDRLLLILHHLVVDGVSWRILLEDLEAAYRQLGRGEEADLPPRTAPFLLWAQRLAEHARTPAVQEEASYWQTRLRRAPSPLPVDLDAGPDDVGSTRSVEVSLDAEGTRALLQEVPRVYRTRINDVLLTALAAAFAGWTGSRRLLVDLEGHGREELFENLDISRTVGWFTTLFPVLLDLDGAAEPGQALKSIKEQLRAVPDGGIGFGLLAREPDALPRAQVVFNYLGQLDQAVAADRLFRPTRERSGATRHPAQPRSHLLEIGGSVSGGRLCMVWGYSGNRHLRSTIEELARGFLGALRAQIAHCLAAIERGELGSTPSDFPLAGIDAAGLDRIAAAAGGSIEDLYPASPVQEGMLFHSLHAPESGVYLEQLSLALGGDLHVAAFERAWELLVQRHPILRTAFHWQGLDRPLQVAVPRVPLAWDRRDWRGLPAEEQRGRLASFLEEDRRRGFDLASPPLLRLALIRLSNDAYRFVWSHHHILLDGWSLPILLRDLFAFYQASLRGEEARLGHARPYRDYIAWLERQDLGEAAGFWRRTLQGFAAPTPLGGERIAGPPDWAHQGTHQTALPSAATEALRAFARQHQVTLNSLVQGAWALLLGRYSGETDVVFGAVTSGRSVPLDGIEGIVGLFINTLPARIGVAPEAELLPWLREIQDRQAELRQYEFSPLSQVQGWSEVPRGLPLFESILAFENYPVDQSVHEQAGRGLRISEAEGREQTNYPLTLVAGPGSRLGLRVLHDARRFDAPYIGRMLRHLENLLTSMANDAAPRLGALAMLAGSERHQLVVDWNDTAVRYPGTELLHHRIQAQTARTPDAVAVNCEGASLSYSALVTRARRLAGHLRRLGVGADVPVGICMGRSLDMVVGLLAILEAGGAYVPLDPSYPAERLAFMLEDALAAGAPVLAQSHAAERIEPLLPPGVRLVLPEAGEATIGLPEEPEALSPDHLAYVIYTSGSTGKPKGAMNTHRAIVNRLLWMQETYRLTASDAVLQKTPMSFDVSVWEFFWPLMVGARLVLARPEGHKDPSYLAGLIEEQEVTTLHFVPSLLQIFLTEEGPERCRSLRRVIASGEALPGELRRRFFDRLRPVELHNLYGPTEAAVDVTFHACNPGENGPTVPIGRPVANAGIHLLDRDLQPVPIGVAGELHIAGVALGRGYLGRPGLTAERFVPDPFAAHPGDRLYRTGDLARRRPDGEVEYLGRVDHQVKIRGVRIELGEIEALLARHPGVREAVVLAREDQPGEPRLAAYVVPRGEGAAPEDLRRFLGAHLPEAMIPASVTFLEALRLLPNGKVDRKALPAPERAAPAGFQAPRTPVEEMLAGIFCELLRVERVGAEDGFFELGGHSLLAMQLVSRIRGAFDVEVPVRVVFDAPAVRDLADRVEQAMRAAEGGLLPAIAPQVRGGEAPLSFAQQRLWFLDQLDAGSAAYNLPLVLRLEGALDAAALAASFQEIARRHDTLRTTFILAGGEVVQSIAPQGPFPLPAVDLSGLAGPRRGFEARRLVREELRRPFDLWRGPLLRAALLALAAEDHLVLLNMHHISSDGWSMGVLVRELGALYGAFSRGLPSPLPELPIQYADFARWQRHWLAGDVLENELGYWRERLRGLPPLLELSTDRPRPAVQTFAGRSRSFDLGEGLLGRVLDLSRRQRATLFMTLLAAFQALLSRHTGQDDLVVGTPIAGRNQLQTEGLIGFFVNTLMLRADLAGDPRFADLVGRAREAALGAYAHQELPFEKLVEELRPERSLGHSPLFQVMFGMQNTPAEALVLPGLAVSMPRTEDETAKFDLSLFLGEAAGRLAASFNYNTDLFNGVTIERLWNGFGRLLTAAVEAPERRVSELPLLGEAERHELLVEWNDTGSPYPASASLQELFEAQVRSTPDAPALLFATSAGESTTSYGELSHRANRLAHRLRGLGVGPESRVGLCFERSPEMVIALLGILKAGGAYVPLDPDYPGERLAFMMEDSGLRWLIGDEQTVTRLPHRLMDGMELILLKGSSSDVLAFSANNPPVTTAGSSLAYVMYTSGSSGRPKGVGVPHRAVVRLVHKTGYADFGPGQVFLQLAPISFDASTLEIWGALLHGSPLALMPAHAFSLEELGRALERYRVTTLWLTAGLFHQLVEHNLELLRPVRQLLAGGEALSAPHVRRVLSELPDTRLINGYGPTENTTFTCCYPMQGPERIGSSVPLGWPIANTQVQMLDPHGQHVPIGVAGELCTGGAGLARGYLGRPDLTAERFIPNPFGEQGGRLYRTGDRARSLPGGEIELLGRIDQQVKIRGFRIEPGEIESLLAEHPEVRAAAVVVREDLPGGRGLVAYVAPAAGAAPEAAALRSFLRTRLPEHMVPTHVAFLEGLPLTPNGKVDRRALAQAAPAPGLGSEAPAVAPRSPIEELLAGIFAELLRAERVDVEESFFDLGGHSLLATQLVSRVRDVLGVEIAVRGVFETPTVTGLAAAVERARLAGEETRMPPITPAPRDADLPLSFAQQRLWFLDRMAPGSAAYNVPTAVRLEGPLDTAALAASLAEVVRRHEALRTTFAAVAGEAVQVVAAGAAVRLAVVDLSGSPGAKEDEVRRLAREEARRPFDLSRGPLLRATLVTLGREEHVLLLTLHHIAGDAWSMEVLVRELTTLYAAFSQGRPSPLPEARGPVRRLRVLAAALAHGGGAGRRDQLLAGGATGAAAEPGPARGQAAAGCPELRGSGLPVPPAGGGGGGAPGARPQPGSDAVHGAARRVPDPARALLRPGRPRRGHADRRPQPRPDRGADRLLRQHPGAAHRLRRQTDHRRPPAPGARDHALGLRPSGPAVRKAGRGPEPGTRPRAAPRCSR